jgi:hypothetical protein
MSGKPSDTLSKPTNQWSVSELDALFQAPGQEDSSKPEGSAKSKKTEGAGSSQPTQGKGKAQAAPQQGPKPQEANKRFERMSPEAKLHALYGGSEGQLELSASPSLKTKGAGIPVNLGESIGEFSAGARTRGAQFNSAEAHGKKIAAGRDERISVRQVKDEAATPGLLPSADSLPTKGLAALYGGDLSGPGGLTLSSAPTTFTEGSGVSLKAGVSEALGQAKTRPDDPLASMTRKAKQGIQARREGLHPSRLAANSEPVREKYSTKPRQPEFTIKATGVEGGGFSGFDGTTGLDRTWGLDLLRVDNENR